MRQGEGQPEGNLKFAHFNLNGAFFAAMDGPGDFAFNEGLSLVVSCDTQEEIDHYWDKLDRRWCRKSMWLAERQIRGFLANCSFGSWNS